jgi:hypothetical protein
VSLAGEPSRPSRVARLRGRRRPRLVAAAGVAVVVLAVGAFAVSRLGEGGGTPPSPSPSTAHTVSDLLVLSITGADDAYVAVIGSGGGRPPAAVAFEPGTTFEVPGLGETTLEGIAALEGDSMRVAVANAIGAWIPDYAATDLDRFGAMLDRTGGLRVDLAEATTVDGEVLGPDEATMTGEQVAAFLADAGEDADVRWASVLEALLAAPPEIRSSDFAELQDPGAAAATFAAARGAVVDVTPTRLLVQTVRTPLQPDFDRLFRDDFGTAEAVRVLVRNANGKPGVGEAVARALLPDGFRVVLSQDAETFDQQTTQILATGEEHVDDAREARRILGVGVVRVSQVPSGLADVTIVVGRDFTG